MSDTESETTWDRWYKKMDLGMEYSVLMNQYSELPFNFRTAITIIVDLFKENTRLTNELQSFKETRYAPYVTKRPRGVGLSINNMGEKFMNEWLDIHGGEKSWRFEYWDADLVKVNTVDYDCTEEQDLEWAKNKLRMDSISNRNVSLYQVTYLGAGKHIRIVPITLEDL